MSKILLQYHTYIINVLKNKNINDIFKKNLNLLLFIVDIFVIFFIIFIEITGKQMNRMKEKQSFIPRYMRLRNELLARILNSKYDGSRYLPRERDICQEFHVSRSTVAKALDQFVEQGLVKRIKRRGTVIVHQKVELLKKEKKNSEIGVVFPLTNYWQQALNSMFDEAGKQGVSLTIYPYDWLSLQSETEAVEKALKHSCGLILYPGGKRDDLSLIEKLDAEEVPLVLFDLYFNSSPVCCVVEDNFYGGYKATEALVLAGRRRIGLITSHFGVSSRMERHAGYHAVLRRYGLPDEDSLCLDLQNQFDTEKIKSYFEQQKPDAVFVLSHMTALQIRHFLIQNGVRVPADVQFAKFDAFQGEEFTRRDITTVVQPEEEMGRQSVRLLMERISRPDAPKRKMFIAPEICVH